MPHTTLRSSASQGAAPRNSMTHARTSTQQAAECTTHAWFPGAWISILSNERAVLAVAAAISTLTNRDGRAWPRRSEIAKRAGIKDMRAVTKAITRIRALRLMDIEPRKGRSTVYVMRALGNDYPGSSLPSPLGNNHPGTLGNDHPPERTTERFQERNGVRGQKDDQEKIDKLYREYQLLEPSPNSSRFQTIGFNGNAEDRARAELRRVPGSCKRLAFWINEACREGLSGEPALTVARRHNERGDGPQDGGPGIECLDTAQSALTRRPPPSPRP